MLLEIVLLLATCLIFGMIFSRLKQSPLVGYLIAGMVMGPGSFGVIHSSEHIETIAELGVALLLFTLGLEFSWQRLKSLGSISLFHGVLQVCLTMFLVAAAMIIFGVHASAAVAVGSMVCLSSTAAVLRVLNERSALDSVYGRRSLAILLVQDMMVVPLAIVIMLLSGASDASDIITKILYILLLAAVLIGMLYVLLKIAVAKILPHLSLLHNRDLVTLFAVVVSLGATWGAHAIGLCLGQVGEFAFVLGNSARSNGVIDDTMYQFIVSISIVTLIATPYLIAWAPRMAVWMEHWRGRGISAKDKPEVAFKPDVVIIGFGPAGQIVGRSMIDRKLSVLVVDLNVAAIKAAESMGFQVVIGDARQPEVLEHLHIQSSQIVVITIPGHKEALAVLHLVKLFAPQAYIVLRSRYQNHVINYMLGGAHAIVGDEERVGEGLSQKSVKYLEQQ